MVILAFNLGASAVELPPDKRLKVVERIVIEVRLIMRGAQATAGQGEATDVVFRWSSYARVGYFRKRTRNASRSRSGTKPARSAWILASIPTR